MKETYDQLGYTRGQLRWILNMVHASRPGFARRWCIRRNQINQWVYNNGTNIRRTKAGKEERIPEHVCRLAKATLDIHILEIENRILRDIVVYRRGPKVEFLAVDHGVSTGLVRHVLKRLEERGIIKTPKGNGVGLDEGLGVFKTKLELGEISDEEYTETEKQYEPMDAIDPRINCHLLNED